MTMRVSLKKMILILENKVNISSDRKIKDDKKVYSIKCVSEN